MMSSKKIQLHKDFFYILIIINEFFSFSISEDHEFSFFKTTICPTFLFSSILQLEFHFNSDQITFYREFLEIENQQASKRCFV